jgi:hypothetical protein
MEVQGKIIEIGPIQEFGQNGFKKRLCVIETEGQYPQTLGIEFVQDKCSVLDNYKKDDDVIISINLRGRQYENKEFQQVYITDLQGWRIVKNGS